VRVGTEIGEMISFIHSTFTERAKETTTPKIGFLPSFRKYV
jgi:hypothetical protein